MTPAPGSRAADQSAETRERILRAALASFSEGGFDGARTRDIAARAGVPLGLLRYHFGDKARLWRASVDRAFAELRSGLEAIVDDAASEPRARLRRLIRGQVAFVSRNPEFVRLMHDEGKRRGPRMRWLVDRHVKPLFDLLEPWVRELQAEGVLPGGVAPVHFIYILVGASDVIFHQAEECKRVSGVDPGKAEVARAHARAIEGLFLGSESASKGPGG